MIKKHYLLLIFLLMTSIVFCEEKLTKKDFFSKLNKDEFINEDKTKYSYFKVGSTPLLQNLGFGHREHDIQKRQGKDLAFNVHFYSPTIFKKYENFIYPSLKYSFLKYRKPVIDSSYYGLGFELAAFVYLHDMKFIGPIPNIEFVWGKELKSHHFSQFGINLVPAVGGLILIASDNGKGSFPGLQRTLGLVSLAGLGISYTFGF